MRSRASTGEREGAISPGGAWSSLLSPLFLWLLTQLVSEAETSLTQLVLVGHVISSQIPQVGEGEMNVCISQMSPAFKALFPYPTGNFLTEFCLVGSSQPEPANLTLQEQMLVARGFSCTSNYEKLVPGTARAWSHPRDGRRGHPHGAWCDRWSGHQLGSPAQPQNRLWEKCFSSDGLGLPICGVGITPSHLPHERKVSVGTWLVKLQSEPFSPSSSLSVFSAQFLVPPTPPRPGQAPPASLFTATSVPALRAAGSHSPHFPICTGGPDASAMTSANLTTGDLSYAHL